MRESVEREVKRGRGFGEWYFFSSNCKIHLLPSPSELIDAFKMLIFRLLN